MGKWNEIGSERERAVERWSYPGRKTKAVGHKPSTYFAQLLKRIECLVRRQPPEIGIGIEIGMRIGRRIAIGVHGPRSQRSPMLNSLSLSLLLILLFAFAN